MGELADQLRNAICEGLEVAGEEDFQSRSRLSVEEVDDGAAVWIRVSLEGLEAQGTLIEPFVQSLGDLGWIQGWCDGDQLTVVVARSSRLVAVGLVHNVLCATE